MKAVFQGLITLLALTLSLPAQAALYIATFYGDQNVTFNISDILGFPDDDPFIFHGEGAYSATFPDVFIEGNDLGRLLIDTRPGHNMFNVLARDNSNGKEGGASFSLASDIFVPGSPFSPIDYNFTDADTRSVVYYPSGFGGPGSVNLTGFSRFTLSAVPAVPEPATWAMMVAGFGLLGAAMRRRRTTLLALRPQPISCKCTDAATASG